MCVVCVGSTSAGRVLYNLLREEQWGELEMSSDHQSGLFTVCIKNLLKRD